MTNQDTSVEDTAPSHQPETPKREKTIPVVEIFGPTVQGEGLTAGQRTLFIRLGLCDYKCTLCDSMHAVDPTRVKQNATWYTQQDLAAKVITLATQTNCNHVCLSGGNPCIHNLTNLVQALRGAGIITSLETQGTFMPDWVSLVDYITVSPKAPGIGEKFEPDKFRKWVQTYSYDNKFCVKIVIFSAQDLEFASDLVAMLPSYMLKEERFYLSVGNPYPPGREPPDLSQWDLHQGLVENLEIIMDDLKGFPALRGVRILPQIHVLLWGNKQGV